MARYTIPDPGKTYMPQPKGGGHQTPHSRHRGYTREKRELGSVEGKLWSTDRVGLPGVPTGGPDCGI